jgi:hypothetical protein
LVGRCGRSRDGTFPIIVHFGRGFWGKFVLFSEFFDVLMSSWNLLLFFIFLEINLNLISLFFAKQLEKIGQIHNFLKRINFNLKGSELI